MSIYGHKLAGAHGGTG